MNLLTGIVHVLVPFPVAGLNAHLVVDERPRRVSVVVELGFAENVVPFEDVVKFVRVHSIATLIAGRFRGVTEVDRRVRA